MFSRDTQTLIWLWLIIVVAFGATIKRCYDREDRFERVEACINLGISVEECLEVNAQ